MNDCAPGPITRPALRYYGGKWRLAPWVISNLPAHESYIEPFAGAASVLLQKEPSDIEVYNDLDGEVVNFFRVLRDQPGDLIEKLRLTPYARAEMKACREPGGDDVERARRLFTLAWQGRARNNATQGWRFQRTTHRRSWSPADDFKDVDRLFGIAHRLRGVQIECSPALEVIERYDTRDALFYCDPPYVPTTRSERWSGSRGRLSYGYSHELSEGDHRELATVLRGIRGMAVVSGYPSDLYEEIFEGWTLLQRMARTDHRGGQVFRTECLWLSPRAAAAAKQGLLL